MKWCRAFDVPDEPVIDLIDKVPRLYQANGKLAAEGADPLEVLARAVVALLGKLGEGKNGGVLGLVEALLWTRLEVMRPDAEMVKESSRCSKVTVNVFFRQAGR